MPTLSDVFHALRKLLHLLARPVKADAGYGGIVIQPYRGYGTREEIFMLGRVFRQPALGSSIPEGSLLRDVIDIVRRILRWGIGEAVVEARLGEAVQQVTTDEDGYFRVHLRPAQLPPSDDLFHQMALTLVSPAGEEARAESTVFVPPRTARFVVISDIDDTVMYTGVANKAMMLWRLFVQGAQSRVAFPGVAAFYRALHGGVSGTEHNPLLYVSRGPWSIYEVLDAFFNLHRIPVGPVLFLREWGLTLQHPLPRRAKGHKRELIRNMLALYDDLPFVLVGDSGQHDPEIYADIVRENPGRVLAIYIRNVSRDPARRQAIEALAEEVVEAGSSLLLASDSFAMAGHAAEHDLLAPDALAAVLQERVEQEGETDLKPTREVEGATPGETREAVDEGALDDAIDAPAPGDEPPNVVVESGEGKAKTPET